MYTVYMVRLLPIMAVKHEALKTRHTHTSATRKPTRTRPGDVRQPATIIMLSASLGCMALGQLRCEQSHNSYRNSSHPHRTEYSQCPLAVSDSDSLTLHIMAGSQEHDSLEELVQDIVNLSKKLPQSVPEATKDDKIYEVMTNVDGESAWATFNRRFDILFGEDCRDKNGRLHHIRRGRHGMIKVTSYLSRVIVNENTLKGFYAPAAIKLNRLKAELQVLAQYVNN